jgi:hypothetical protein
VNLVVTWVFGFAVVVQCVWDSVQESGAEVGCERWLRLAGFATGDDQGGEAEAERRAPVLGVPCGCEAEEEEPRSCAAGVG